MSGPRSHPWVSPDVADGVTTPLPADPSHPELDGRARTAGQTWIGWRVQLLPGEVAEAGDPAAHRRRTAEAADERHGTIAAIRGRRGAGRRP